MLVSWDVQAPPPGQDTRTGRRVPEPQRHGQAYTVRQVRGGTGHQGISLRETQVGNPTSILHTLKLQILATIRSIANLSRLRCFRRGQGVRSESRPTPNPEPGLILQVFQTLTPPVPNLPVVEASESDFRKPGIPGTGRDQIKLLAHNVRKFP